VENAISKLYKIGMEDRNPTALKQFIQFADPSAKAKTINNFVQINNVKITQEKIQELPYKVKNELETILMSYQLESSQED
jgi:predicted ATP-grasp superfamily ATP-dependent carboligase